MDRGGSLVTCIASALSMRGTQEVTPGGYSVNVYSDVDEQIIYQWLSEGHYPIVRVRVNGIGNWHYVLVVGLEDQEYICMDPLKNYLVDSKPYIRFILLS